MNWKPTVSVIGLLAFCLFTGCEEDNKPNTNNDGGIQCGNGIVEYSEKCDRTELSPFYKTCNAFDNKIKWKAGGTPGCDDQCQLTQGTCKPLSCGNGEIDEGEECDGNAFKDSKTPQCSDKPGNWDPSILPTCASDCTINYKACVEFECGDGIRQGTEQCDGDDYGSERRVCSRLDDTLAWYDFGRPKCKGDCTLDIGSCNKVQCGDITCPAETPYCHYDGSYKCVKCLAEMQKCIPEPEKSKNYLQCGYNDKKGEFEWEEWDCPTEDNTECVPQFMVHSDVPSQVAGPIAFLGGFCVSRPSMCNDTYDEEDELNKLKCDSKDGTVPSGVSCSSVIDPLESSPFTFVPDSGTVKCSDRCTLDPTDCELENNPPAGPIDL